MRSASSSGRSRDAPARSPVPAKEEDSERRSCAHRHSRRRPADCAVCAPPRTLGMGDSGAQSAQPASGATSSGRAGWRQWAKSAAFLLVAAISLYLVLRRCCRSWGRGGRCRTWSGSSRFPSSPPRPRAMGACGSWTGSRWEPGAGSPSPAPSLPAAPSAASCRARPRRSPPRCCAGPGSTPARAAAAVTASTASSSRPRRRCRCWRCRRSSAGRRSATAWWRRRTWAASASL